MANKRIMKVSDYLLPYEDVYSHLFQEFQEITSAPPEGCTVALQKENDMNVWDVHMEGPSDSIYQVRRHLSSPSSSSLFPLAHL